MTLRLKDQSLQERLDSFSNGKFSKELEECAYDIHSECIVIELDKYGDVELSVFVRPPALEKIPEYDPNDWNEHPGVIPPVKKKMRIDCFDEKRTLVHSCCGYWTGNVWMAWNGYELNAKIIRFRPWDD